MKFILLQYLNKNSSNICMKVKSKIHTNIGNSAKSRMLRSEICQLFSSKMLQGCETGSNKPRWSSTKTM